ncbi:MAG: primosomal protein N' [Oscillospiraceae bacterium]|nr:primosomal protein N' [Oscillospiraceae bacterium]
MVARVALSGTVFSIDKLYDYLIPARLEGSAAVGKRVSVPFARGNRRQEGLVFALAETSELEKLKPVDEWLDEEPILSPESLRLAAWMKQRFFCTYYDAVRAMLPAGIWLKSEEVCALAEPADKEGAYAAAGEDEAAKLLLDTLFDLGGSCSLSAVKTVLREDADKAMEMLAAAGVIRKSVSLRRAVSDRTATIAALAVSPEEAAVLSARKKKSAPQQAELLRLLSELGETGVKELRYFTGAGMASVRALERAGLISLRQRDVFRRPEFRPDDKPLISTLNAEQQQVYEGLARLRKDEKACAALLYGVTGSGKTAVYIRLIRDVLSDGKQALVLVPEIALTPQLVSVFYSHFGDRVAVLHSSLTVAQRYDEWKRIRTGLVDVAVGTRSAVFAPLDRLGLVILDEEHESTYQSESAPRYHARDVAKFRCVSAGCMILLGSATPSVESMYEAKRGVYRLFRLRSRFNTKPLPRVLIADMKEELRGGGSGNVGSVLRKELEENFRRGEQSILFLNRRGSSSLVHCPECGFTFSCPRCSVKLTYHAANSRFMCHFCGHSQPAEARCPACGGRLAFGGVGTQKLEEELRAFYPEQEILRMDTDTVTAAHPHEELLRRFERERIPILIGTQMVSKGLNFENVTLVGVISADQSLYAGDYRAQERTFSLITQVVGRAGRGSLNGRAVIQTFTPDSEVILCASRQDYDAFYASEIETRRLIQAPPYRTLYTLNVTGSDETLTLQCVTELARALKRAASPFPEMKVLGPAPAGVLRVNDRFRYRVTLSAPPSKEARTLTASALRQYAADRRYKNLVLYGAVDPLE